MTLSRYCKSNHVKFKDVLKVFGLSKSGMYKYYERKPEVVNHVIVSIAVKQLVKAI